MLTFAVIATVDTLVAYGVTALAYKKRRMQRRETMKKSA